MPGRDIGFARGHWRATTQDTDRQYVVLFYLCCILVERRKPPGRGGSQRSGRGNQSSTPPFRSSHTRVASLLWRAPIRLGLPERAMAMRVTRYAKSGDVHIAYEVFGSGPIDMV